MYKYKQMLDLSKNKPIIDLKINFQALIINNLPANSCGD